jgi:iron complex outermembrane receptor protein
MSVADDQDPSPPGSDTDLLPPQPEEPDVPLPDEPSLDFDPLAELEALLGEPVIVPGPSPGTLTEVVDPGVTAAAAAQQLGLARKTPAAVTRIDSDMIWDSGARRLTELLDIYVPNTQIVKHHFSFEHLTPRGLVSDLEDKYLFQVNGKTMNHQTITGAFSEIRDLPLLGDIHHVDFIRGPGSALYGPGAISGVVSVVTHDATTFEGTDATLRQGAVDTFTGFELRHGCKFDEGSGIFAYFGIADYQGASYEHAPLMYSSSFPTPNSIPDVIAGEPVTVPDGYADDRESWRSLAKMKVHAQYTKGNFDFWVRYTQGGEKATPQRGEFALPPFGGRTPDFDYGSAEAFQFGYVQYTVLGRYLWELNECLSADFRLSYDSMDFTRYFVPNAGGPARTSNPHREEEFYGRALVRWTPNDKHASAVGFELSRGRFGLGTWSFSEDPASTIINGTSGIPWYTTAYSFLGEHQWKVNDLWTVFLTGRWDKHSFTETLFSPRAAIVFTPNDINTVKFIATESVRRLPEDVLYGDFRNNRGRSDVESIESLELRYERRPTDEWLLAASGFYQESEFVGLSGRGNSNQGQYADVAMWGVELEAVYRTERSRIVASQSYTGLILFDLVGPFALADPFDLADPFFEQRITAAPYGFGNDLANQSPHLTKLAVHYDHCCCWSSDASLRVYWGFPGDEDLTEFDNAKFAAQGSANRVSDPGFTSAFREAIFLNYALNYRPNDWITARVDLYNILGWFDRDLNKRNFIFQPTTYRDEAAAVAATVRIAY